MSQNTYSDYKLHIYKHLFPQVFEKPKDAECRIKYSLILKLSIPRITLVI